MEDWTKILQNLEYNQMEPIESFILYRQEIMQTSTWATYKIYVILSNSFLSIAPMIENDKYFD